MAFLRAAGAEIDVRSGTTTPDSHTLTGTVTRDTGVARTGAACWKCDSTAGNTASWFELDIPNGTLGNTTYYFRHYFRFANLPGSTVRIFGFGTSGSNSVSARLTAAGKLQLWNDLAGTQIGSDSAATIAADDATWYRLEMAVTLDAAGTNVTAVELLLGGVQVGQTSGLNFSVVPVGAFAGWRDAPGASKVLRVDDYQMNDSTGAVNNGYPGDGKVLLMKPTSDGQRGSWTGGAGGTTNLWDAVNNTPPIGTATETDLTQIENVDTSPDNATDEYRGNCGSYTTAGVGASDSVKGIFPVVCHGEDVATGTKTGSFGLQANPADTYTSGWAYGQDVGALGTYPSNWAWQLTDAPSDLPTVTLSSALIIAVRKTDTGSRVASVSFLGAYVAYTPFVAAASFDTTEMAALQAVERTSLW